VRLHAIVGDAETARWAAANGASVVQLRLKDVDTGERVRVGRGIGQVAAMIVINDDVEAAIALAAGAVHLGQDDAGVIRARDAGMGFGRSVSTPDEARAAVAEGAIYLGAGPIWATPSKLDAGPPIGLQGLAAIAQAVSLPVVAIGGINASNAAACIDSGAAGVAVVRGVAELRAIRDAVDAAINRRHVEA
jgi:thiamine-phosphate pyrophosphorylase